MGHPPAARPLLQSLIRRGVFGKFPRLTARQEVSACQLWLEKNLNLNHGIENFARVSGIGEMIERQFH